MSVGTERERIESTMLNTKLKVLEDSLRISRRMSFEDLESVQIAVEDIRRRSSKLSINPEFAAKLEKIQLTIAEKRGSLEEVRLVESPTLEQGNSVEEAPKAEFAPVNSDIPEVVPTPIKSQPVLELFGDDETKLREIFEQKGVALFQKDINNYTLLEYITKIFCDFFQIPYQVYDVNNTAFGAQLLHQIVASPLVLEMAIEYGADINSRNNRGDTAVMDAAARGYTDSVEYLISQGANLKDINQEGENIMHKLSTSFNERDKDGQLAMIAILEKNGVLGELLNQKNRSGKTPLDIARENGKAGPLVEMLESKMMTKLVNELDRTANPAAQLKEALGAKSEEERIYIRDTINQLDSKGQLALNKGVYSRDVLDVLIQNGADVNARNSKGETAAMEAAAMGFSSSVKFLVEKGANLTVRDNDGQNLLHKLAARKDIPAKKIFGILDILTDDSIVGDKSVLMELLNQKNEAGKTPLDIARESGNHELVTQVNNRLMLDAGKRASIKDVENLAGSGVDIRVIDHKGENMLHKLASGWGVESIAQSNFMSALQEKGVLAEMIQQKNNGGKTPLDIAKEKLESVSRELDSTDGTKTKVAAYGKEIAFNTAKSLVESLEREVQKAPPKPVEKPTHAELVGHKSGRSHVDIIKDGPKGSAHGF